MRELQKLLLWLTVAVWCGSCHRANTPVTTPTSLIPKVMSCSMQPPLATLRPGDSIPIHVQAVFPNNFPLTYYWTSQAGTLKGKGADMVWWSKNTKPGTYAIEVRIDDGHGAQIACSMAVTLQSDVGNLEIPR